jgi:hypothetical protein
LPWAEWKERGSPCTFDTCPRTPDRLRGMVWRPPRLLAFDEPTAESAYPYPSRSSQKRKYKVGRHCNATLAYAHFRTLSCAGTAFGPSQSQSSPRRSEDRIGIPTKSLCIGPSDTRCRCRRDASARSKAMQSLFAALSRHSRPAPSSRNLVPHSLSAT